MIMITVTTKVITVSSLQIYIPLSEILMSGNAHCGINLISVMPTSSLDLSRGNELKPIGKIINDGEDVSVPFNLHQSIHQIYPDLASCFVEDVHCLQFGVHFVEMDRHDPLTFVARSDVVGNVRIHSRQMVPFGDFLP